MERNELKSCPFCGGNARMQQCLRWDIDKYRYFVACEVCGVETPRIARTRQEAASSWNRRIWEAKV